jgi:hypothetical protein
LHTLFCLRGDVRIDPLVKALDFLFWGEDFEIFRATPLGLDNAVVGMKVQSLGFASKLEQFEISPSLVSADAICKMNVSDEEK